MGWAEVLDEMEGRVRAAERLLRDGGTAPAPVDTAGLGPLPEELRSRAEQVLGATVRVQARAFEAREVLAGALGRPRYGWRRPAAYVDVRA